MDIAYRLGDLIDLAQIQKMAEANYAASGMPIGIVDANDGKVLVGVGWQEICTCFHRANPASNARCQESDAYIRSHITDGEPCEYRCRNGLWDIGIPILVEGRHLATLFLGQFIYEGEHPDRNHFVEQAREFGYDEAAYLAALDKLPVFSRAKVVDILRFNQALAALLGDLATKNLSLQKEIGVRTEIEKTLRRTQVFEEALLSRLPVSVAASDMEGSIIFWNPASEHLFGRTAAEVLGKADRDVFPGDLAAHFREKDLQALRSRTMEEITEILIDTPHMGKRLVHMIKVPISDGAGNPLYVLTISEDITEHKRVLNALKESEARWQYALEGSGDGVWDYDLRTHEVLFSHQWKAMLGYADQEVANRSDEWYGLLHPEDRERARQTINDYLEGRIPSYVLEHRLRCKDGSYKWILSRGKLIERTPDGKPLRMIGTHTDITERKRMEDSLRESETRLKSRLDVILQPDVDIADTELTDIIDIPVIQGLLEDFSKITGLPSALLDLKGNVLVEAGWQEVCTKFHRQHPLTARNCRESDLYLTANAPHGQPLAYRCKNRLWDVVIPIRIGEKHIGNLFYGQFFYEDEEIDIDFFTAQAERYGFDKEAYLAAIGRAPRVSRQKSRDILSYYSKFASMVSQLSFSNIKLARSLENQKDMDASLRTQYEFMNRLIDTIPSPLFYKDVEGRYLGCNSAFEQITGMSKAELIGRSVFDVARRELAEQYRAKDIELMQTGGGQVFESHVIDGEGRLHDVIFHKGTFLDAAGAVGGIIGIVTDITERKRAEEARLEIERRLLHTQRLESLGVLAGGIAHDFNNLLMAILGNLELALSDIDPGAACHTFIEEADKAARRAADLTRQMLAYSGKGRFVLKHIDLNTLLEDNAHLFRASIPKTITFDSHLERDLALIEADPGQIQQVIMNLITNASEAIGDADGVITITTGVRECDEQLLAQSRLEEKPSPGRYVFLEVADTGCGMDEETKLRLFDPFFTTKFTGRGLGLSAILGIVRSHGGAIVMNSTQGVGTTVRVFFPVAAEPGAERQPAGEPIATTDGPKARQEKLKILLVDDEPMVREVERRIAEHIGYQVFTAEDGMAAVEVLKQQGDRIACVILDLSMPKMDGLATLAEIRKILPGIKVILSTGHAEQDAIGRFDGYDLAGFIQKPYQVETLKDILDRTLAHAGE